MSCSFIFCTGLGFCLVSHLTASFSESEQILHEKAKYTKNFNQDSSDSLDKYYAIVEAARNAYKNHDNSSGNPFKEQIKSDLKPFRQKGVTQADIEKSKPFGTLYQIIDHRLYRQEECMFPARCQGIEHFLIKVAQFVNDTEFVINVRDWPQADIYTADEKGPLPVFSFSKDNERYLDILYPAWSFWSGGPAIDPYPSGIGRWDRHRESLKSSPNRQWKAKSSIGFFRGSRTSQERDPLILLSKRHVNLIDAKYTKNQAWRSKADTLGDEPVPMVTFEDQCKYKYLFNLRGVAASFRHRHLFLCNSVVLDVDSEWVEFYYHLLKPWIHYVPLKKDMSDVVEILRFLQLNDALAQEIANEGFKFVWNHLTMDVIQRYWTQLIKTYTKLLKYKPKRVDTLIEIKA